MTGEEAVRLYLLFRSDPESMRDDVAIAKAQKVVEGAKDPVDKLLAIAALKRAQQVNGDQFRSDFVAHAKAWAEANGVPVDAFTEMGVPNEDLVAAGLTSGRGGRKPATGSSGGAKRSRAPRVSTDEVRAAAKGFATLFTVTELMDVTKSSPGTVRKVVSDMVAAGELKEAGADPEYAGRGRAPTRFDNS